MTSVLKERLRTGSDCLPTCMDYSQLLSFATDIFHIRRNEAYRSYGNYSYTQWRNLLLDTLRERLKELKDQEQCGIVNTHKIVELEGLMADFGMSVQALG